MGVMYTKNKNGTVTITNSMEQVVPGDQAVKRLEMQIAKTKEVLADLEKQLSEIKEDEKN